VWFKTRVGLVAIDAPVEFRIWRHESGHWGLIAQLRSGPEAKGRSLFGKINMSGPWFHLAQFRDHSAVQQEIGQALERIVAAAQAAAPLCDLSDVGHPEAWVNDWNQVAWPRPG
jgi:hypothetical protein